MSARRLLALVAGAIAFGAVTALVKGPGGNGTVLELRSVMGNVSAPWVLVAFFAGAQRPKVGRATLLGLAATLLALVGFYAVFTLVVQMTSHGYASDLRYVASANRVYFEAGLVTGPAFGALGGWWRSHRPFRSIVMVGVLLIGEPIVLVAMGAIRWALHLVPGSGGLGAVRLLPGWGLWASSDGLTIGVYVAELMLGLAVLAFERRRSDGGRLTVPAS